MARYTQRPENALKRAYGELRMNRKIRLCRDCHAF